MYYTLGWGDGSALGQEFESLAPMGVTIGACDPNTGERQEDPESSFAAQPW